MVRRFSRQESNAVWPTVCTDLSVKDSGCWTLAKPCKCPPLWKREVCASRGVLKQEDTANIWVSCMVTGQK